MDVLDRFLRAFSGRLTLEGELIITSDRHRDQPRNIADCVMKLEEMLSSVIEPPKKRKKTKPTRGSHERRIEAKKNRSAHKESRKKIRYD